MKYRLSFDERNEIAFKLRSMLLSQEAPDQMEALSDPRFQPHELTIGIYAFEFFLTRFRPSIHKKLKDPTNYNLGWATVALRRDEESRSMDRLIRMTAILFMSYLGEQDGFTVIAKGFKEELAAKGHKVDLGGLELFLYEILYELVLELARELATSRKS